MKLYLHCDLPESFLPKARFALKFLLSKYDLQPVFTSQENLLEKGGLFYGLTPVHFEQAEKPVINIISRPETWAYFENRSPYDSSNVEWLDSYLSDQEIPVLFGENREEQVDHQNRMIYTDIVASTFFWLSDWQQVYVQHLDDHDRIAYAESLQQELNIADQPVVDEYRLILEEWLKNAGYLVTRNYINNAFVFGLTFDLDNIRKSKTGTLAYATADLVKKADQPISERFKHLKNAVNYAGSTQDAFQVSIQKILHFLDRHDINSTIFLKSVVDRSEHDARDYLDVPFFQEILRYIDGLDSEIGYHSSYRAGFEASLFQEELQRLRKYTEGREIVCHRSHYLRYDWRMIHKMLHQNSIAVDSSKGWADRMGFRTGTCFPHPVFDIDQNRPTSIMEVPMLAMDVQLLNYMEMKQDEAVDRLNRQLETVKKYGGAVVWNFHHHIYDSMDTPGLENVFEEAVSTAVDKSRLNLTLSEIKELYRYEF